MGLAESSPGNSRPVQTVFPIGCGVLKSCLSFSPPSYPQQAKMERWDGVRRWEWDSASCLSSSLASCFKSCHTPISVKGYFLSKHFPGKMRKETYLHLLPPGCFCSFQLSPRPYDCLLEPHMLMFPQKPSVTVSHPSLTTETTLTATRAEETPVEPPAWVGTFL